MRLPELHVREYRPRRYLLNDQVYVRGRDVVVALDTRSPMAPDYEIPAGTVLVQAVGEDRFVVATDARADHARPARVSSLQPADAQWASSVITVSLSKGLGFAVVLDAAAVDNASVLDQLNRHAQFSVHFLADEDAAGNVRVTTRHGGATSFVHVQSSLDAAFGVHGLADSGTDPEVCVADALGELRDLTGQRIPAVVPVLLAGHFLESSLIALTPEARRVLSRRGSLFS